MWQHVVLKRISILSSVCMLAVGPTLAYAWGGPGPREHFGPRHHAVRYHDHPRLGMRISFVSRDYRPIVVYGTRYYYYDGLYYAMDRGEYVLVEPPVGAVVSAIPPVYLPVEVNGVTYYTDGGIYYVYTGRGYQVVPPPAVWAVIRPTVVTRTVQVAPEPRNQTKVAEGIGLGGILGAVVGGIVGHQSHHGVGGALLGGVAGAAAGGIIGAQIPDEDAGSVTTVSRTSEVIVSAPIAPAVPVAAPAPAVFAAQESVSTGVADAFTVNVSDGRGGYVPVVIRRSGDGFVGPQGEYYSEFPKVAQLQVMYGK